MMVQYLEARYTGGLDNVHGFMNMSNNLRLATSNLIER